MYIRYKIIKCVKLYKILYKEANEVANNGFNFLYEKYNFLLREKIKGNVVKKLVNDKY